MQSGDPVHIYGRRRRSVEEILLSLKKLETESIPNDMQLAHLSAEEASIWDELNNVELEELEGVFTRNLVSGVIPTLTALSVWVRKVREERLPLKSEMINAFKQLVLDAPAWKLKLLPPPRFAGICRGVALLVVREKNMFLAKSLVLVMRIAGEKTEPSPMYIMSIHVDFLLLCITAKVYWIATPLLTKRRLKVDPRSSYVEPSDVMLMYYYLGVVGVALKKYRTALQCFKLVRMVPASNLSNVAIAAFEKFVLVSLIVHGEWLHNHERERPMSPDFRAAVLEYVLLASAYSNPSETDQFKRLIATHREKFTLDGNKGLIRQVELAHLKRQIARLSDSYVTVDFDQVARKLGIADRKEVKKLLLEMVSDGTQNASWNEQVKMVSFTEGLDQGYRDNALGEFDSDGHIDTVLTAIEQIHELREEYSWKDKAWSVPMEKYLGDDEGDADSSKSQESLV